MLSWFHDNNTLIYLALGSAGVVLGALWWRTQNRRYAQALGLLAVILVALALFDYFGPESPGREVKRKINEMSAAVKARQPERVFAHVSDGFKWGLLDKPLARATLERLQANSVLTEMEVWAFQRAEVQWGAAGQKSTTTIQFRMKPRGRDIPGELFFRMVAIFVLDPDGQWRMQTFELYRQPGDERWEAPASVPGM